MPPGPIGSDALKKRLLHLGVGKRFGAAIVPSKAREGPQVRTEVLLEVHAKSVFTGDVPWVIGDVRGRASLCTLNDLIAIDAHVGGVGVAEQTNDPGLLRQESFAEFVFDILRMRLPRLPDEVDSVGDFGHEGFAEAKTPALIFKIDDGTNRVATSIGGIVPGAIVVDGPVKKLKMGIAAGRVDIEEVWHAELAKPEFDAAAREFLEQR